MFLTLASTKFLFFIAVAQALWLLCQLKICIYLQCEKWKLRFIAVSLQIFWQKFCRNVCWLVLQEAYHLRPNLSICWNFAELFIILASIKLLFFYCHCLSTLVAMATLSFYRLIIGTLEIGVYCCSIADILTKHFRNVYWVVLYQTYTFCPNLIGCHGNQKTNFAKNIKKKKKKKKLFRSYIGDKAETLQKYS